MEMLTATFGTFDFVFFVFLKGKSDLKGFLTIFAIELITRHKDLQKPRGGVQSPVYARGMLVSRQGLRKLTVDS